MVTDSRSRTALRWAGVPLAAAVIAAAAAALVAANTEPVYRAATTLVVAPSSRIRDVPSELRALETLERRSILATMAKVPSIPEVRAGVATALGLPPNAMSLYSISCSVQPYASVLTIEVEGPDAARTAAVANAAAEVSRDRLRRLYSLFSARVLEPARPPGRPIRPDVGREAAVAALLGLFVGALALAAWSALRSHAAPE